MRNPEVGLELIKEEIMYFSNRWVKTGSQKEWGVAAGLTHAYLYMTGDKEGYNEYYAMLGVF